MIKIHQVEILGKDLDEYDEASKLNNKQSTDERWILDKLETTIALGEVLIKKIPSLKLLLLEGPLGVGKTSLVKGIAMSLGIMEPITSPTFALAQHYLQGRKALVHLDLYRFETKEDADMLFLQEEEEAARKDALLVVEWPERLGIHLPDAWLLKLQYASNGGRIAQLNPPEDLDSKFCTSR